MSALREAIVRQQHVRSAEQHAVVAVQPVLQSTRVAGNETVNEQGTAGRQFWWSQPTAPAPPAHAWMSLGRLRRQFDISVPASAPRYGGMDLHRWASVEHVTDGTGLLPHPKRVHRRSTGVINRAATSIHTQPNCSSNPALPNSLRPLPETESHQVKELGAPDPPGWSHNLASDLEAVCMEAGLPSATAKVVVLAVRRGRVTRNPGLLLYQALRVVDALEVPLSRPVLLSVLRACPHLLSTSTDFVTWHLDELEVMFGRRPLLAMVSKCPLLLWSNPFTVWSNLEALARLLDSTAERMQALVARQPRLLLNSPSALAVRASELLDLLELERPALQRLLLAQPALLSYHPTTLAHNLEAMASCLGMTLPQVVRVVTRSPTLLMLSPQSLKDKLAALGHALSLDPVQASTLILRQPSLLCVASITLADKLQALAAAMGINADAAVVLARARPALLTLAPCTLARKLAALWVAIEDAQSRARQTAAGWGSTCQSSQGADEPQTGPTVATRLATEWARQLGAANVGVRATYACFSEARYARLGQLCQAMAARLSAVDSSLHSPAADSTWNSPPHSLADKSSLHSTAADSTQNSAPNSPADTLLPGACSWPATAATKGPLPTVSAGAGEPARAAESAAPAGAAGAVAEDEGFTDAMAATDGARPHGSKCASMVKPSYSLSQVLCVTDAQFEAMLFAWL